MFADDTNLLIHDENFNHLHTTLKTELEKVSKWVSANTLKVNVTKTNYIFFPRLICGVKHEESSSRRVWPDEGFMYNFFRIYNRWEFKLGKEHIKSLCLKLSKICGIMFKVYFNITIDALKNTFLIMLSLLSKLFVTMGLYMAVSYKGNYFDTEKGFRNQSMQRKTRF